MLDVLEDPTFSHAREAPIRVDGQRLRVVMADDCHADQRLLLAAIHRARLDVDITFMDDGVKLLMHLHAMADDGIMPDLVIVDLRMPNLDGHRVLDELQGHPVLWQIPVIVFTGSVNADDRREALHRGAGWFEVKPIDFEDTVEFVKTFPQRAASGGYQLPPA